LGGCKSIFLVSFRLKELHVRRVETDISSLPLVLSDRGRRTFSSFFTPTPISLPSFLHQPRYPNSSSSGMVQLGKISRRSASTRGSTRRSWVTEQERISPSATLVQISSLSQVSPRLLVSSLLPRRYVALFIFPTCFFFLELTSFSSPRIFSTLLGQVVLEALASGLPVIGLDAEGTRDLVSSGSTGLLLPLGAKDWPAALKKVKSATFVRAAEDYAILLARLISPTGAGERREMSERAAKGTKGRTWHEVSFSHSFFSLLLHLLLVERPTDLSPSSSLLLGPQGHGDVRLRLPRSHHYLPNPSSSPSSKRVRETATSAPVFGSPLGR